MSELVRLIRQSKLSRQEIVKLWRWKEKIFNSALWLTETSRVPAGSGITQEKKKTRTADNRIRLMVICFISTVRSALPYQLCQGLVHSWLWPQDRDDFLSWSPPRHGRVWRRYIMSSLDIVCYSVAQTSLISLIAAVLLPIISSMRYCRSIQILPW